MSMKHSAAKSFHRLEPTIMLGCMRFSNKQDQMNNYMLYEWAKQTEHFNFIWLKGVKTGDTK